MGATGAWITGSNVFANANASVGVAITFTPLTNRVVLPNGSYMRTYPLTLTTTTGGSIGSNFFVAGPYRVSTPETRDAFTMTVPADDAAHDWVELSTNVFSFITNVPGLVRGIAPGTNVVTSTNANGVVTVNAASSGSGDLSVTNALATTNQLAGTNAALLATITTSSNALFSGDASVNLARLGEAWAQIGSGSTPVKIAILSDVTPLYTEVNRQFLARMGRNGFDIPGGDVFGYIAGSASTNRARVDGAVTFTNWPGDFIERGAGDVYRTTNLLGTLGGTAYGNRVQYRAIRFSSGGTDAVYLKTNGGAVTLLGTVDTSGTPGAVFTNWSAIAGNYQVWCSNATANVIKFLGPGLWDTNGTGLTIVGGTGGPNFDSADVTLYTNVFQPMMRDIRPALTFFTDISGATNYATNAAAFATFTTNLPGSLLWVTGTPLADDSQEINLAVQRPIASSNGIALLDMRALFGNNRSATNRLGTNDGVHLNGTQTVAGAVFIVDKSGARAALDAREAVLGAGYFSGSFSYGSSITVGGGVTAEGAFISSGSQSGVRINSRNPLDANDGATIYRDTGLKLGFVDVGGANASMASIIVDSSAYALAVPRLIATNVIGSNVTALTLTLNGGDLATSLTGKMSADGATNAAFTNVVLRGYFIGAASNLWVTVSNGFVNTYRCTNGAPVALVTSVNETNGNVGIGTNATTAKLEVQGGARFSGGITNTGGGSLGNAGITYSTAGTMAISGSLNFNGVNSFSQYGIDMGGGFTPSATVGITRVNKIGMNTNDLAGLPLFIRQPGTNFFIRLDSGIKTELFTFSTNGFFSIGSNALGSASVPTAAQIGLGGTIYWNSNGSHWISRCLDGSTVESKSLW